MMKKKLSAVGVILLLLLCVQQAHAQKPPFWEEIQNFKKQDSAHFPPPNAILFTGSSSFRLWEGLPTVFPGYSIINRGFGGSAIPDVIRYAGDIIFPYHPKQVVIYCGDNDLAASDTVTAQIVFNRFRQLFDIIRTKLPSVSIVFASIKPSPSRQALMPRMEQANGLIKSFLEKKQHTAFVDVYHLMLTADGKPVGDLFREDKLHMNAKGYAIWQKAIQPYLLKP